jgi:hypothetical protein
MTMHSSITKASGDIPLRPRAHRTVSLYLLARMRIDASQDGIARDGLCRVRNMSASGLMLESEQELTSGQMVTVEFRDGSSVTGRVAWAKDKRAGLHIDQTIDVQALLGHIVGRTARGALALRTPRFDCDCRALVRFRGRSCKASIANVSINGMQLAIVADIGDLVHVKLPGLPEHAGRVRWCQDGQCGVMLMEPYPFIAMSRWLASQDRGGAEA